MSHDLARMDALAQAKLVKTREISPRELVEAAIARIEKFDPQLNAVIRTDFERAIERASGPLPDGPFVGVPYLVKDLLDYAGMVNSRGSRLWEDRRVDRTAEPIVRAERAGVVVVGKSNTPEFGLMATTESLLLGPCRNPWDLTRSPGGSSGGAAAAVAAGLVPMAHATDGGGSIRMPASCCGLFGLKPSHGRISQPPEDEPHPLVAQFGITRSVRDSAALLAVSEDETGHGTHSKIGFVTSASKERRRIGYHIASFSGEVPHAEVAAAIEATARLCEALGHSVVEAPPPLDGREFWRQFEILWGAYPAMRAAEARERGLDLQDVLEPWTIGLADHYRRQTPEAIAAAVAYVDRVRDETAVWFTSFDLMLSPVLSEPPVLLGAFDQGKPFDEQWRRLEGHMPYTAQHNAAGTPAMSVPLGWSSGGLPIGSQFAAAVGGERMLLELAYELEAAQPWSDRWPPFIAN